MVDHYRDGGKRKTVDPPFVRIAVWLVVLPILIGTLGWTVRAAWDLSADLIRSWTARKTQCEILNWRIDGRQDDERFLNRGKKQITYDRAHSRYHLAFHIRYAVNGTTYETWTYGFEETWVSHAAKDHLLAHYQPGDKRPCFYVPGHPAKAALTRDIPLSRPMGLAVSLVAFLFAACLFRLALPLMYWKKRPADTPLPVLRPESIAPKHPPLSVVNDYPTPDPFPRPEETTSIVGRPDGVRGEDDPLSAR